MRKLITVTVITFVLSFSAFATSSNNNVNTENKSNAAVCEKLKADNKQNTTEYAQRGCCSWHKGVCGCTGGRVVCCDNTYSPSCLCNKEQSPEVTN